MRCDKRTIRAYLLSPYVEAMENRGIEADLVLRSHGICRSDLAESYSRLPLPAFLAVTEKAARLLGEPCLGLRLGAELVPEQVGSFGLLMATSHTLRDALATFSNWAFAMQEGWQLLLVMDKKSADYIYRVEGEGMSVRHDVEFSIANLCSLIRTRMGPSWCPMEVHFEHSAPPQLRLYERILGAPVLFDQACNKIVISRADLGQRTARVNHALIPLIDRHLRGLAQEADATTTDAQRASLVIARILGTRQVTVDVVAHEMGMSVRSLQRRLGEEGTSFRALIREERRRIATNLLARSKRSSITEIAMCAGYADASVLSHAFKTWTGTAPSRFGAGTAKPPSKLAAS